MKNPTSKRAPGWRDPDTLIDRNEAMALLGISRSTIIRYEQKRLLQPIKLNNIDGGRVRYKWGDIQKKLARPPRPVKPH